MSNSFILFWQNNSLSSIEQLASSLFPTTKKPLALETKRHIVETTVSLKRVAFLLAVTLFLSVILLKNTLHSNSHFKISPQ